MPEPIKPARRLATPRTMTEAKPAKSAGFWIFVGVAGLTVLLLGGLAFMVVFMQGAAETALRDAEWQTVTSDEGGFGVELPTELVFDEKINPDSGLTLHVGTAQVGDVAFEVTYFDPAESRNPNQRFNLREAMARVGVAQEGSFGEFEDRAMGDHAGQFILVNLDNGRQTRAWGFRREGRVYLLAAHNVRVEDADLAERFFSSFELRPIVRPGEEPTYVEDYSDGNYSPGDPLPDTLRADNYFVAVGEPLKFERGQLQREKIEFVNGEPPYLVEVLGTDLPTGLTAAVVEDAVLISGTPAEPGMFSVSYRVKDTNRQILESTIKIEVIDNPFTISVSGLSFADGVAEVRRGEQLDLTFKLNGPVADDPRLPSWLDEEIAPGLKAGPGEGDQYPVSGKCTQTGRHAVRINVLVKSSEDGEEYECRYEVILNVTD